MILTPHLVSGALIGAKIHSFWAIMILAILSHFLLDRLPHWEYADRGLKEMEGRYFLIFVLKALVDLTIGLLIVWRLFHTSAGLFYALGGAGAAVLPDGLIFLNRLTRQKIRTLAWCSRWHDRLHLPKEKNAPSLGLALEILVIWLVIIIS